MRVAVVGAGVMGCAAAWALSRRGHSVAVFEQFADGHQRGSSHGESRVIRKAYFEHPDYVPLLEEAYRGWTELERGDHEPFFIRCGGLFLGQAEGVLISGCLDSAIHHGLDHEVWSFAEVKNRFPSFAPDEDMVGFWDPAAGVLRADAARRNFLHRAKGLGAEFRFESEPSLDGFDRIVVTAGPWAARYLSTLNLALTVTRQVVAWAPVTPGSELPTWAVELPDGTYFYGFPELDQSGTAKLASHAKGRPFDPDSSDRDATEADDLELAPVFPYLPGLEPRIIKKQVCLYTNTPDDHFILDVYPEDPKVVYAAGFSGHGFKFAPVIGEALADLAESGGTELPIEFLRNRASRWVR